MQISMKLQSIIIVVLLIWFPCCYGFIPTIHHRKISSVKRFKATALSSSSLLLDPREIARSIRPSVAMVVPVGVRNFTSRGSGFVVDFDNDDDDNIYLLTAAHVAAPGYRIEVVFFPTNNNSTTHAATVIGRDTTSDLALLKISHCLHNSTMAKQHHPLEFSNEEVEEVGTPCFAIGFPSGGVVGSAMTSGIVCASALGSPFLQSKKNKNKKNSTEVEDNNNTNNSTDQTKFVVTDAAMAGGMSGGPLVNDKGLIIGVNALVNMELRALGNYAVHSSECLTFMNNLSQRMNKKDNNVEGGKIGVVVVSYGVMLFNDPFNKRKRVSDILTKIVNLDSKEANKIMMEAHRFGTSTIRTYDSKEEAKILCDKLRSQDILVEVQEID